MAQTAKLSIIIPVYKAEAYIKRAIDDVLSQDFRDMELILVDDGSPDGSAAICEAYAAQDPRIHVLKKANGGASSARNAGLRVATGEYVLFIDSDDRIEPGSLNKVMRRMEAEGARDVTFLKAMSVYPDGSMALKDRFDKAQYDGRTHDQVLEYLAGLDQLPVCVWGKLIRRSLLLEHSISFLEGVICEDVDFCIHLYLCAKTFNYIDEDYYYYTEDRPGSVMSTFTDRKYHDLYTILAHWAVLSKGEYSKYGAVVQSMLAFQYVMLLGMYARLPKPQRRENRQAMRNLAWLLGCAEDTRVKLLNAVCRIFGIGGVSALMKGYEALKQRRARHG